MRRFWPLLLLAALASCATRQYQPAPAIDPVGDFRIVAINGEATGGGERFTFDIHPPSGNAQFGCNRTGGSIAVGNNYVSTGQWIMTTASCGPRSLAHFERDGFAITALPMAVERNAAGGIRLRNRIGSLELVRAPDLVPQIIGNWSATSIDGRPARADERIGLTITPTFINSTGVCNDVRGSYSIGGQRLMPNGPPWPRTERGCDRDRMSLENRVYAVFWNEPAIAVPTPDRLRFTSLNGSIEFERKR